MTDTPTPRRTRRADRYREDAPAPEAISAPAAEPAPAAETSAQQYTRRRAQRHQPELPAAETPRPRTRVSAPAQPDPAPAGVPRPRHLTRQQPVQETVIPRQTTIPAPAAQAVPAVRRQPAVQRDIAPPVMDRPPAAPQRKAQRPPQKSARPRMPLWMTVCIVVMIFFLAGLFTAQSLMQAYLVTREDERQKAYQRVVDSHPIYYKDIIDRYAEENNLHPAFVAAIILNESSYRTDAVSRVGARGLMQLMPDTAEWIAGKLDVTGYSFDRMFDAESNIRFGTWYLGYLSKLFRGDPVLVAAAYHAGQGEVTGWLSDDSMSQDGVTIRLENMIDGPTKSYAGRVTQAYAIYETLFYRTPDSAADDAVPAASAGG